MILGVFSGEGRLLAESMRSARTDVLAFAVFPRAHWRKIWSNNPLERLNRSPTLTPG